MNSLVVRYAVCFAIIAQGVLAAGFEQPTKWKPGAKPGTSVGTNANGRVIAIALANGKMVRSRFDERGRHIRQSTSTGEIIHYDRGADGRILRQVEQDITTQFVYDRRGRVIGSLSGESGAELHRASAMLKVPNSQAPELDARATQYDALGRAKATALVDVDIEYEHGTRQAELAYRIHAKKWSYELRRAYGTDNAMHVEGSDGRKFIVGQSKGARWVLDGDGRSIVVSEYDVRERPIRTYISNRFVIEYLYGNSDEWVEKVVRHRDGSVVSRFARSDYPDPELQKKAGGFVRAATGDVVAKLVNGELLYTIGSPIEARVGSDGVIRDYTYAVPSRVAFAEDQVRVMPDGSLELLVALPHAEMTGASRTVYPFKIRIAAERSAQSAATAASARAGKTSPARAEKLGTPRADYINQDTYCDYVGQTSSWDASTATVTVVAAHWECVTVSYETSGWGYTYPIYDWTTWPEYRDPYTTPLSAVQQVAVEEARSIALERICDADCTAYFASMGASGEDIIRNTTYLDGSNSAECQECLDGSSGPDCQTRTAWTRLNSMTVWICSTFTNYSSGARATLIIHEALHSAGLSHDGGVLTNEQMNAFAAACGE